jgi:hypothetical protein
VLTHTIQHNTHCYNRGDPLSSVFHSSSSATGNSNNSSSGMSPPPMMPSHKSHPRLDRLGGSSGHSHSSHNQHQYHSSSSAAAAAGSSAPLLLPKRVPTSLSYALWCTVLPVELHADFNRLGVRVCAVLRDKVSCCRQCCRQQRRLSDKLHALTKQKVEKQQFNGRQPVVMHV